MSLASMSNISQQVFSISPSSAELYESTKNYSKFNQTLQMLCAEVAAQNYPGMSRMQITGVDLMRELRNIFSITELRESGSFFTGDALAAEAVSKFDQPITPSSIILDPTCGAGNLLLASSKKLPIRSTLKDSLRLWGQVLTGLDVFPEFVETTKLRLILEAYQRGAVPNGDTIDELKSLFQHIRQGDALLETECYSKATHVIMNPPYGLTLASQGCSWGGGKINAAGIFVEHMLDNVVENTSLVAILPDVLRSGSRYGHWRVLVDSGVSHNIHIVGRFDHKTDVDVFLLSGNIRKVQPTASQKVWENNEFASSRKLADHFTILVGPVVQYRDQEEGASYPYIFPRMLPKWEELSSFDYIRQFRGRVIQPPFVAIRRTSSPSDTHRALATIICGNSPVAVENHLIVAVPNEGGLKECRRLLKILRHPQTNEFLNNRIRCRHLTVGAVKDIPWIEGL